MAASRKVFRLILSIFIVFHLFAILLAPNSQTYLGIQAAFFVQPYVNFLGLASQWGFFAPDPGPPPVFIEYELFGDNGSSLGTKTWPEKKSSFWLRERQNRRIAVARFLVASNERTEKMMGPYLCSQHREARSVKLWRVVGTIPNLHEVAAKKRVIGDDVGTERKFVTQYLCSVPGVRWGP